MADDEPFLCWACGKHVVTMHEIAQGVCDHCKGSIIRKNLFPLSSDKLVSIIMYAAQNHYRL